MHDKRREFAIRFGNSPFRSEVGSSSMLLGFVIPIILVAIILLVASTGSIEGVSMAMGVPVMAELVEKRKEFQAKQDELAKVFEDAGSNMDMSKVEKFGEIDVKGKNSVEISEMIQKANLELNDMGKVIEKLVLTESALKDHDVRERLLKAGLVVHPDPNGGSPKIKDVDGPQHFKSIGELVVENEEYVAKHENSPKGLTVSMKDMYPSDFIGHKDSPRAKTLFETTAGWAPESIRIPRVIEDAVTVRPKFIDVIPFAQTGMAAVVYMEETTRTHSAAEKGEGLAYAESAFVLTEQTSNVRKITDSVPVTDEQLDDVSMVQTYLDGRLRFGLKKRLSSQAYGGNGVAPNLLGVLNVTGLQTQAKGSDAEPSAIHRALTKVRVTGDADPNAVILHPNDWETIVLLQTADGIYIWGHPSAVGPTTIWGLPVIPTAEATENTGLVGDFANFSMAFERKGVDVQIGFVDDDFAKGRKTLRADTRVAIVFFRGAAFCTITGI